MAITISGSGITSANIADGTITTDDISSTGVKSLKSGRKNLIINGGFDVWQRGTTGTAQGYNSADRWYISRGGGSPAVSITRETFATTETNIRSKYYLQWVQTTGGTSPYIVQRVEEVKPLLGQEVTVSVWMKAASAVTIDLDVYIDYGDGQSTTLDENTSFSVTTSWQKFQHTFTVSSGGTVAANSNLEVRFAPPDSNTITTSYAEAQLELGDTATDFEHRSYGEELALCQRYFHSFSASNVKVEGYATVTTYIRTYIHFPVTMRVAPTASGTLTGISSNIRSGDDSTTPDGINNHRFYFGARGATTGRMYQWGTSGDVIELDAEL